MLEGLVGNKNVQNVLLFLFVNGKCYGAQVQRLLKCPLTPVQKALARLEKSGIILSFYEGKTRLYQFNPSYALFDELEELLKKAYLLLSPQEKKRFQYVVPQKWVGRGFTHDEVLQTVWHKLQHVKRIAFHATTKSKDGSGWNGKGLGEVRVLQTCDHELIFHEKGSWKDKLGDIDFSNVYRWTYDSIAKVIALEHLRHGIDHPVFLFHLAPVGEQTLASINAHHCDTDAYFGQIFCDAHCLRLSWRAIGPKKNDEIQTYYT